ncbi:MAG: FAD-dependent monooxygenase, partial [Myxococcota bacterium]
MERNILVAGAGPGGLVAALALARKGFGVRVLERSPELRTAGAGLTLQVNAVRMLDRLGLADAVVAAGERLVGGAVETADGRTIQRMELGEAAAKHGRPGVAIRRGALSDLLAAAVPAGALRFGAAVSGVRQDDEGVTVTLADGAEERGVALIGADGIHSAVRSAVFGPTQPRYTGYTCWRGLADRATGLGDGRTFERWGAGRRFGMVPVGGGQTYWFATLNAPAGGVDGDDVRARLAATFADFAEPVPALIAATPAARILRNDIVD